MCHRWPAPPATTCRAGSTGTTWQEYSWTRRATKRLRRTSRWRSAAQQAAAQQVRQAQLEILCLDATRPLNERERQSLTGAASNERIVAWTKADLATNRETTVPHAVFTSSVTGEGVATLRSLVVRRVSGGSSAELGAVASTAVRCRASLLDAAARLQSARRLVAQHGCEELVAVELRDALDQLGQIVGAVHTDDILDRIFSRFCIGK